ncbi:MAG: dehydratase [Anaerolineae bacterium]|nr:dehydratase [Anaerolineae bacterium]
MANPAFSPASGLFFEQFTIGQAITTDGRTVTETDVVNFAGLSGDYNPMHTNAVFAASTPFGQRVAHGALVFSLATGLAFQMRFLSGTVLAFRGVDEWKFSAPVLIGDTIHCAIEVEALKPAARLGGGMVTFKVKVVNQEGKSVQSGRWTVLVASQSSSDSSTPSA